MRKGVVLLTKGSSFSGYWLLIRSRNPVAFVASHIPRIASGEIITFPEDYSHDATLERKPILQLHFARNCAFPFVKYNNDPFPSE